MLGFSVLPSLVAAFSGGPAQGNWLQFICQTYGDMREAGQGSDKTVFKSQNLTKMFESLVNHPHSELEIALSIDQTSHPR